MFAVLRFFRSTMVLLWLCGALAASTIALGVQAMTLSAQVATLTSSAAATALKHRKEVAKAVSKTKAKARLRRMMVAVPVLGGGAALAFEAQDYQDWQAQHPDGSFADYTCEAATLSAEVVDETLQELPETLRPSRETVLNWLGDCPEPVSSP
ncbi:hypothetical protein MWU54_12100 [Marivita sp. S6314]|uniref:hypothetical protein n=1 Tax=Marivita sp. S6314 TaxID=2926406 RepID=UPI001FF2DEA1|nr:hypothetical protein [Marivita sp. S6314]MCK0150771.1 hypothetical protein [Marivita sp. S6314]